jgi:hypothetical protein
MPVSSSSLNFCFLSNTSTMLLLALSPLASAAFGEVAALAAAALLSSSSSARAAMLPLLLCSVLAAVSLPRRCGASRPVCAAVAAAPEGERPAEISSERMIDVRHSRPRVRMWCSSCCAFLLFEDMKSTDTLRLLLFSRAGFCDNLRTVSDA